MPVHVYQLDACELVKIGLTGPTLDAVSMQLPPGSFTTFRTYEQYRVLGLSAHLQRLVDSHAALCKNRPLDLPRLRWALGQVIERENLPAARLRVTAPFDAAVVLISLEPFEPYPPEFYIQGVRCVTTRLQRDTPQAKQTTFIAPSRALKAQTDAHIPHIHEMLMVDAQGRILEGITSNFFAVLGGKLRTAGQGILEGITRSIVLQEASQILPVAPEAIHVNDLSRVSEAFITSSTRQVMPVIQVDNQIIGNGLPGEITRGLMERYHARALAEAETVLSQSAASG
jgi:branched-chain amino acid aminotransferase